MQSGCDHFGQVIHEDVTAVYFSQLLCQLLFPTLAAYCVIQIDHEFVNQPHSYILQSALKEIGSEQEYEFAVCLSTVDSCTRCHLEQVLHSLVQQGDFMPGP